METQILVIFPSPVTMGPELLIRSIQYSFGQSPFFMSFLVVWVGLISPLGLVTDMYPTWTMRVRPGTSAATIGAEELPFY